MSSKIKKSIKDVLTLKSIYPQVYVVNMKHISNDLEFTNKLNVLGTWIIKNGSEWVCKTDLSEDEFKEKFIHIMSLSNDDSEKIEIKRDYLPFGKL